VRFRGRKVDLNAHEFKSLLPKKADPRRKKRPSSKD
jgi:hypothetical protein